MAGMALYARRRLAVAATRTGLALGNAVATQRELERRADAHEHGRRVAKAIRKTRPGR